MKTVRQQIVDHLQVRGKLTALELSHALRVTPANVRHHLSILLEEGAIQVTGKLPPKKRGRPAQVFNLTTQTTRHNLDKLASVLLEEIFDDLPGPERAAIVQKIAARLKTNPELSLSNLTQRLNHAIHLLNEQHYAARWEAHADAPQVILGNCPYSTILADHPELCLMDSALLSDVLGAPVLQTAKMAEDSRGSTYCRFAIRNRNIRSGD